MVPKFKYLGLMISLKDTSHTTSEEIRVRRATARSITRDLVNVWKGADISISLKKRFMYPLVWSTAQYGSESWTLKEEDEKLFKMWVWRRMLRISWAQGKTNI